VHAAFKAATAAVLGLAHSIATDVDLCDKTAVDQRVQEWKPTWIVHNVAEHSPDVAQNDPAGARKVRMIPGYKGP